MVVHNCEICGYITTFTTHYNNHLKTKKHIRNVEKYNKEKNSKQLRNSSHTAQSIKCEYCNNTFSKKFNLKRHYSTCLVKKELDEEKRKEEELKKEEQKKEEQKKQEKDIVVNKLLEEITKMKEEQKKKEDEITKMKEDKLLEEITKMKEEYKKEKEEYKKEKEEQNEREKKMLEEIEKLKLEKSNLTTNNTTNNTNNTNNNSNNTNNTTNNINNGTVINQLNNLNINFSNVIPMETFLYNMEHKYLIPEQDIEAILYANDNLKIDDVADRIVKTLIANCKRQVKDMMIDDKKVLPIMPVLSTDSNLRSHKERLKDGWDTLYDDKYLDRMLSIINNRMCDLKRRVIFISKKNKNKVFNQIKKKTSMADIIKIQKEINGETNSTQLNNTTK